jgi:hypothetical protein
MLSHAPAWLHLVVKGSLLATVGVWVLIRFALPYDLAVELVDKLPKPMRRPARIVVSFICGRRRATSNAYGDDSSGSQ